MIKWKDGGRGQERMAMRDSDVRWQRHWIDADDCGGLWQLPLPQTMMTADDNGVEQRPHMRETRQDGEQRWHSALIRGNNC